MESQTREAITELVRCTLHKVFCDVSDSRLWRVGMSHAMINFHFHVSGRIRKTTEVLIDHRQVHDMFSNC